MGCFCDARGNEIEEIMKRNSKTGKNYELNQENTLIENERHENNHQNKINLFDSNDEKGKAQITKNNLSSNQREEHDQLKFNKDFCKSLASSLPKRKKVDYQAFKDLLKSKTVNLSDKEKSFIIFLWIGDNISYDLDSYFARREVDCSPKGVFKSGSSVCSGYSRLYKDFADNLNLEVECVPCYSKGAYYSVGDKLTSTDHEYNVIKLNNKWYPIDSTWGAGHVEGKKYIKSYNEFYFLADPELLIKTHFPADDKWQLTKKKYTLEEFLRWPNIKSTFYNFGFEKYFPEEGIIELKNKNIQEFIIYGNNINQKGAACKIYLLEGSTYVQQSNSNITNIFEDRIVISAVFNKK